MNKLRRSLGIPGRDPYIYGNFIYDRNGVADQQAKDKAFSKWLGQLAIHMEENEVGSPYHIIHKYQF